MTISGMVMLNKLLVDIADSSVERRITEYLLPIKRTNENRTRKEGTLVSICSYEYVPPV